MGCRHIRRNIYHELGIPDMESVERPSSTMPINLEMLESEMLVYFSNR